MSRVKAISGATGEQLAALTKQARELGATTVWSAKEAAEGMTFLSMAGFNANQTMAAMPGMLSLASAGAVDLGTTADIASNILTGFGFEAGKMTYVGDVLAKTFTRSNTTLQSLGESFKYCGPAASKAGQSFETAAAMIGALGNAGIQGSEAGTGLNAIISRMASPPKAAATALNKLGISVGDAQGNMRSMPDLLHEINQKTKHMGEVELLATAKALFGVNHFAKGLALLGAEADGSLGKLADGLYEEGYATRVAKEQTDNLMGDLKGLNSAWQEVAISIYDTVSPALRAVTQGLTTGLRAVGTWINANPRLARGLTLAAVAFVTLKTVTLAGMIAFSAMKTVTLGMSLAMGSVKAVALAWAAATRVVTAGQWLLNAALTANPIGIIIMAVAALIAGLVYLYNTCEPVRAVFDRVFTFIGEKVGFVADKLRGVGEFLGILDKADAPGTAKAASAPAVAATPQEAAAAPKVWNPQEFLEKRGISPALAAAALAESEEGGEGGEEEDLAALMPTPAPPAKAQKRRSRKAAGGAQAPEGAPSVQVSLQFAINGMPAADFAQGVVRALTERRAEVERLVSGIVHDQMRAAHAG